MDRLSRELYAPVRRWAARWADSADDAEDIAQEAMIKLLTRFESFRAQGQIESFDQFVVLLKNAVSQMVYKHAISTVMPVAPIQLFEEKEEEAVEA